ncbi:MAG: alpha-(1-_3)-arabinofuranosyltransferase family protein [Acidimicrobiia bacterium]
MHTEATTRVATRGQRRAGYALLALLAWVPLLLTHPGRVVADTKSYLYLDPGRLLVRAVSMWDPHIGLGTVTHQNIGYLFPMGPLYWFTNLLGVPAWVAQRLWLGAILFFAGLGMAYLMRTLKVRGPGVPVAVVVFMLSPYALDFSARLSVILLPWAGLPWMLALVIRALREDRGWMYPAWFAITVQIIGGVNATALVFAGIAPVVWIVYAAFIRDVAWKRALVVTAKIGLLTLLTSLWWMAGLSVQGTYGLNVLKYTETLSVVTKTSLASEVLRGLGYWFFYGIDKLGHWTDAATTYTRNPVAIVISFAVPVLALLAAACVRWRHRSYFVVITVIGVAVAVGAYPFEDPSPLGGLFKSFAESSSFGLALRSTSRAVPLVVMGLSVLLGVGVNAVARAWPGRTVASGPLRGFAITGPLLACALVVLAIANQPALWNGSYSTKALERDEDIPQYWTDAIKAADAGSHQTRILEVPGADFAAYRWGQTIDPVTPGLTDRPYVARELVPWGSPASADLVNAYDRRMQEGVLSPDAVAPVARLISAGVILYRADLQTDRFGLVRATEAWNVLTNPLAPGLAQPQGFGDSLGPPLSLAQVDEIQLAESADQQTPPPVSLFTVDDAPNIVRAQSSAAPVVVSGDGEGVVDLAAIGLVQNGNPIFYSASDAADAAALRAKAGAAQSVLVVTDTNRKRARRWGSLSLNLGYTERAGETPLLKDENDAPLELFPDQKPDAQTTTETPGVQVAATHYGQGNVYEPMYRPVYGIDGNVHTAWVVGEFGKPIGEQWQVRVDDAVTTDHVNLVQPLGAGNDRYLTRVELTFDGKDAVTVDLGPESRTEAGQTIGFPQHTFHTLGIRIVDTNVGDDATPPFQNGVGLAEVRLDDANGAPVLAHEVTVMPTDLVTTAGKQAAARPLVYSMARLRSNLVPPYTTRTEDALTRRFEVPNGRTFGVGGTARLAPDAPDPLLDALLGIPGVDAGGITVTSSGHMAGSVLARGSSATDGNPATAWTTPFGDATGQWVQVTTAAPVTVDHLDLQVVADAEHSLPKQVQVTAGGVTRTVDLPVIARGATGNVVTVPLTFEPVTGSDVRVAISAIDPATTTNYHTLQPQVLPVAIAELGIPGVQRAAMPAQLPSTCRTDLTVDDAAQGVQLTGNTAGAEAGDALAVQLCGGATDWQLGAGDHTVAAASGPSVGYDVDTLVLGSDADGAAMTLGAQGTVPDTLLASSATAAPKVKVTHNGDTKVEVSVTGATPGKPFWLVLGQSDNAGWEATADGKDLGGSTLINGYANAWKVTPTKASFTATMNWAPQRTVWIALAVSTLVFLVCLVLGLLGWRRRRLARRTSTDADDVDAVDPSLAFANPLRAEGSRPRPVDAVVTILGAGITGAVLARPWVGLVCAVAAALVLWRADLRLLLTFGAPMSLALCALYIVVQQHRYDYVSDLDWPNRFTKINDLAWLAVLLLFTDVLVQWARRRGERDRAQRTPELSPDPGPAPATDQPDASTAASPDR